MNILWLFVIALTCCALPGCVTLPPPGDRLVSTTLVNTQNTRLGKSVTKLMAGRVQLSGLYPLADGVDAFVARLVLIEAAERSLDLQYYIWRNDETGRAIVARLLLAADRGVRVRLLIDDVGAQADDKALLSLAQHPNIEVGLFNPVALRNYRGVGTLLDAGRLNHRMHNKSLTADNQVTIVGGRNIGDEYFNADQYLGFADLDVVAVGKVVPEVSSSFDLFWNSEAVYPITSIAQGKINALALTEERSKLTRDVDRFANTAYGKALADSDFANHLRNASLKLFWAKARALYDDPKKIQAREGEESSYLMPKLGASLGRIEKELIIVSAYFVPGREGTNYLTALSQRGVNVIVVTNSLASTDVAPVHAGYRRYRKSLLKSGVRIYEVKASTNAINKNKWLGSSKASLHAKTYIIDREQLFVGSLNLDPRSVQINTEIGLLIESEDMAGFMMNKALQPLSLAAYRVELVDGKLRWHSVDKNGDQYFYHEPDSSMWRRFVVWFVSLLPVESQL